MNNGCGNYFCFQTGSVPKTSDAPRRNELKMRVEESQRKVNFHFIKILNCVSNYLLVEILIMVNWWFNFIIII